VLLDGAQMPPPRTLPPRLEGLLRRQALPLRAATFDDDLERLTARLERVRTDVQHVREQVALRATAHEQQELSARRLAAYAESTAVKPRALPRAGLLALESMLRFPLPGAHNVLRQVRAGLPRNDGELAHAATVTAVAESASGRWIATGSADGVVKIWDAPALTLFLEKRTGGKVEALAFGADESWLAAASGDSKVAAWELASGGTLAGLETQEPVIKLLVPELEPGQGQGCRRAAAAAGDRPGRGRPHRHRSHPEWRVARTVSAAGDGHGGRVARGAATVRGHDDGGHVVARVFGSDG
jgi:hypothetical protein